MTGVLESPLPSTEPHRAHPRRFVLGVGLDPVTLHQAKDEMLILARTRDANMVLTPNVDHVIRTKRDTSFREICDAGDLVLADGTPVAPVCIKYFTGDPVQNLRDHRGSECFSFC